MIAVVINVLAIIFGCALGLFLKRGIPESMSDALMKGLGLCTLIIGIQGAIKEQNIILLIIAVVAGIFIGELKDWDGNVNRSVKNILVKLHATGDSQKIAEAFVTACLVMNVGAMVIVGSLNAGLSKDYAMLYTKSLLDFISGIMLGATLGIGVMGAAVFTFVFQGAIVVFSSYIAPYMSTGLIAEINCTGCLMIVAIGLNMLNLTQLKVINFLPSLLIVPVLFVIKNALGCL
jgi:uncharacterized protein